MIARVFIMLCVAGLIFPAGCSKKTEPPKPPAATPEEPAGTPEDLIEAPDKPASETTAPAAGATDDTEPPAAEKPTEETAKPKEMEVEKPQSLLPDDITPGLYAVMQTSMGDIIIRLFEERAPKTVDNFVGLATGTKEYTDPKTGAKTKGNFYDGLIFHRVIRDFMIQGGDPLGNGTGGPGYKFEDELDPKLNFDAPGYLAMANSGPNTNGSQFFITVKPTPWLNQKHTIFGSVVKGMDVVLDISKVQTGAMDRPVEPVVIRHVAIERKEAD